MTIALVPHIPTPSDARKLHLWIGVADVEKSPTLTWKLNGAPIVARPLRPVAPVLQGKYGASADTNVFSGFYEVPNLRADSDWEIEVRANGERIIRTVRTLPTSIPSASERPLNILLLSCFHFLEDKTGIAGRVLSQLKVIPHLTLFMGDQVYLDLPTLRDFSEDPGWLGNKFQNDYLDNWFGARTPGQGDRQIPTGYPQVLSLAPAAFLPDDHEYWNNYPYTSSFIQNTWSDSGRRHWTEAAEMMYRGFQQTGASDFGRSRVVEINPLSILLLDTRSQRATNSRNKAGDLLGTSGREALRKWAERLVKSASTQDPHYGMLVTGQSLFRSAVGSVKGKIADFEFPDYAADYRLMVGELERIVSTGLPVICATGDVHWGRILRADENTGRAASIYEVISSPTSLVSTVFADQVHEAWGAIRGLFGARESWPRHSDPDSPPPRFGNAQQYATNVLRARPDRPAVMRGNHAIMLRLTRAGARLHIEATCYPLHENDEVNFAEQWSTQFELRPTK